MKKNWKIRLALLVLIFVFVTINNYTEKELREYVLNKELQTIKPDWKGNIKIDGEYVNFDKKDEQKTPIDIFKWKVFSTNPQEKEKKDDDFRLELIEGADWIHSTEDMIVWLGHASFFIRLGGTTLITDPVFYNLSFIKRHIGIPCDIEEIKGIDYLLLSHGHRDHFDKKTLNKLISVNPDIEALVPLDNSSFFKKKGVKFQEAGWYQKYKINTELEVFLMPAKHWNRRGLFDFNKTCWGSFILKYKEKIVYFSGDTSMGDHFEETAKMFPEIDYCLLPVGAYKPEDIMKEAHLSPQEAYEAFQILGGKTFIPMHFGTYDLGDEPLGEPKRVLEAFGNKQIKFLKVGEVVVL
ncbi:MAG: hypothetical protein DRI89_11815 [Bacteroidetes bacterium]|nr:MAG: hypothetical protein DRI89_11815 [Bacteroidota bacterium]